MTDWSDGPLPQVEDMPVAERLVEDLLAGAWDSHSYRETDRSAETLNKAGKIREWYYDERE